MKIKSSYSAKGTAESMKRQAIIYKVLSKFNKEKTTQFLNLDKRFEKTLHQRYTFEK